VVQEFLGKYRQKLDTKPRYGGFGIVYECLDLRTGETVAVKVTKLDNFVRRLSFSRECKSLMRLSHPNIIRLLDYDTQGEEGIVVMPWLPNNLEEFMANQGNSLGAYDRFLKIVIPILNALAYAHENGVDHRDIKPTNVLVDAEGNPLLSDWGSAKVYGIGESVETVLRTESGFYTPEVPGSPEKHDVYSFGLLAIFILQDKKFKNVEEALDVMNESKNISEPTRALLGKCLERWPDARYSNALELSSVLMPRIARVEKTNVAKQYLGWIKPTKSLSQQIQNTYSKRSNPLKEFENELSSSSLYLHPLAKEDGGYQRLQFQLISDRFRIDLKVNESKNGWLAEGMRRADPDDLEFVRERSLALVDFHFPWIVANSAPLSQIEEAKAGHEFLTNILDQWIENGRPKSGLKSTSSSELNELVNRWTKLMDVKEEIFANRYEPIEYEKLEVSEKKISLILRSPSELDLMDTNWKIPFEKPESAQVIYHQGSEMQLLLRRSPKGKPKKEGTITPDLSGGDSISLERQKSAINSIVERSCYQPALADFLADPSRVPISPPFEVIDWKINKLDESKKSAVSIALGSKNFAVIQGPPGTGKTAFIAEYIHQELKRDPQQKILLVSQTHVALDNALTRLSKEIGLEDVVRLGRVDDDRISESNKKFLLDNQLLVWKNKLLESSTKFALDLAKVQGIAYEQAVLLIKLKQLESLKVDIIEVKNSVEDSVRIETSLDEPDGILTSARQLEDHLEKLEIAEKSLVDELTPLVVEVGLTMPKDIDLPTVRHLRGAIETGIDIPENFLKIIETQSLWSNKIGSSTQIAELFLKTRKVLTGTCLGFLSVPEVRDMKFDICIVDEASKATVTEMLVPMTKSAKWVIVGDSNQLSADDYDLSDPDNAPILEKFGLEANAETDNLFENLETNLPKKLVTGLNIQYRMAHPIGSLVSDLFYEGKLSNSGPSIDQSLKTILPPVLWYESSTRDIHAFEGKSSTSFINQAEVAVIQESLNGLRRFIELGLYKSDSTLEVLIISPYKAQIQLARNTIKDLKSYPFKIEFNSVDAVQGREADIVFFSAVRNNEELRTGFLNKANWRRVNVALSRAKRSMVIVGNIEFWQKTNSSLSEVVKYIEKHAEDDNFQIRSGHVN
jgi:serine/threonine protein kinase